MTYLALNLSHYVNGVAKKHGEVTQAMFSRYVIDAITNGVHAVTWVSDPSQRSTTVISRIGNRTISACAMP